MEEQKLNLTIINIVSTIDKLVMSKNCFQTSLLWTLSTLPNIRVSEKIERTMQV